jgi:monoamine oxidase
VDELEFDSLVVGAGIAGLSAARVLAEGGKRVALVEARSRVGGRIHSVQTNACDLPIELGAEFVHGRPAELLQLISEAGKKYFELGGRFLCAQDGRLEDCAFDEAFSVLHDLPEEPDQSFAEWMARRHYPPEVFRWTTSYVEGFNAADAKVISTKSLAVQQRAEDSIEGDRIFRVEEGYSAIVEYLARKFEEAGGSLFLAVPVDTIRWGRGSVRISGGSSHDGKPRQFRGRQCIITLPLGVMHAAAIHFDPIPERAMKAAQRLAMGAAKRITLVFRERFWAGNYPDASFIFAGDGQALPSTWWSASPRNTAMLTGWVGGPRTQEPAIASERDLMRTSVATLARIFSLTVEEISSQLLSWHSHDWQADPFSRGAYTYVPKGALHASSILAEPVEDTLFFAGEHSDVTGHWGTVHGALRSGLRAAGQAGG